MRTITQRLNLIGQLERARATSPYMHVTVWMRARGVSRVRPHVWVHAAL